MTDEEHQELVVARGTALAAIVCLQQIVRVMLEAKILLPEQAQDAISEALAMAATLPAARPIEAEINAVIQQTIVEAFRD